MNSAGDTRHDLSHRDVSNPTHRLSKLVSLLSEIDLSCCYKFELKYFWLLKWIFYEVSVANEINSSICYLLYLSYVPFFHKPKTKNTSFPYPFDLRIHIFQFSTHVKLFRSKLCIPYHYQCYSFANYWLQ